MKIRLDQVTKPFNWQETLKISSTELEQMDAVSLGEIECRGKIRPMVEDFLLQASLSYEHELSCMRCLRPATAAVSTDFEFLVRVGNEAVAEERELQAEELGLLIVENPEFDTRPVLIEQVQLAVPMKTLCKEDCPGLCSSCGADLNEGRCECGKVVDPRWGALASLGSKSSS